MGRLCRTLIQVCWALGLLSMLVAVLFRVVPTLAEKTTLQPRGGLILAGILYLCALATREVERTLSSGS